VGSVLGGKKGMFFDESAVAAHNLNSHEGNQSTDEQDGETRLVSVVLEIHPSLASLAEIDTQSTKELDGRELFLIPSCLCGAGGLLSGFMY